MDNTEVGLGQGRGRVGEEPGEPDEDEEVGDAVSPPLGRVVGEVQWLRMLYRRSAPPSWSNNCKMSGTSSLEMVRRRVLVMPMFGSYPST